MASSQVETEERPPKRNLELERRLRKAPVQHGADREPHAAIKQRRRKPAMDGAGGVEMPRVGLSRGNNAALRHFQDVIAERLRHGAIAESWGRKGAGGSGLGLRSDDLDSVSEPFNHHDFRRLVVTVEMAPASLGGLRELEDHGQRSLVRETPLRAYGAVTHCCERAFDDVGREQMLSPSSIC